jgi:crotonobetainyl-CoA:carnitine CoA-transferase CaiB-like acyl-CoA transferase
MMNGGALEGVKILDCTQILAGPFCTMMLGDMGADVIKIEKPAGGDDTRRMGPPFVGDTAAAFLMVNRNKRSVALDLKSEEGIAVFHRLVEWADVLVENLRPGAMTKLGLGYEQLKSKNPKLVYCSISGFGATGPYKDRSGFDLVAQGMSGHMSFTGHPDSEPVKVSAPITDLNAGMFAVYGILSAYIHALRTGDGQYVDTSLLESGIAYTVWESAGLWVDGVVPGPVGSRHRMTAPYQAYRTADGHVNIGVANQNTWARFCAAITRPDMRDDPRFSNNADRVRNLQSLRKEIERTLGKKSTADWCEILTAGGVPSGPIYDLAQVYGDEHVKARGMEMDIDHPTLGPIKNVGPAVKLSATPGTLRRPPPDLGQHTDAVLEELGYSAGEIASLRESGAAGARG